MNQNPIRVMVVDDSALYRKVISDALSEDGSLEVMASAPNGRIALMKMPQGPPDVITLDMEMPEMDGLTTLRELRKRFPQVKTIVFSHHTEKGAELTLQAMELGAVDFVTKPTSSGSLEQSLREIKQSLAPKIVEVARRHRTGFRVPARGPVRTPKPGQMSPRDVFAIGISTGGPNSLMNLFAQLPSRMKQAILIVQHMPAIFTRKLAEQLTRVGTIPVCEAKDGELIEGGKAYIAPGDFHMEVVASGVRKFIRVHKGPQENYCRPAVDILFRSVAEVYGARSVGVIMTGMGKDGFEGCKVLKRLGAPIIAQDEESCVVWGMPRFVTESGLADSVVPLDNIYQTLMKFTI